MNSMQSLQIADDLSKYSCTIFLQPSPFLRHEIGDFKDVLDMFPDVGSVVDFKTNHGLCFDPIWILTPFLDEDTYSQ